MEIPFHDAAELLASLFSRGAGAAAATVGEQAGARTLSEAGQIARGLQKRLEDVDDHDGAPSVPAVEAALREAVADGEVTGDALMRVVAGGDVSIQAGHSVFVGSRIETKTFNA